MSFFDDAPPHQRALRPWQVWERPDAALPGIVPAKIVMVRTEQAAIAVTGLWAFRTGFEFFVSARLKSDTLSLDMAAMLLSVRDDGQRIRDEFLRFGVEFATGEKATNMGGFPDADIEPGEPILSQLFAGAGRRSRDWRYWVWPLPPAGPVTFVCAWPYFQVPETRVTLDAQILLDAAEESIQLWPEDVS